MNIEFKEDGKKGSFYVAEQGKTGAEMTFVWAGEDRIIIDHTEVGEQFKGMGVGKQLVEAAVGFAREKKIKIIPLCPFAKSVLSKNESYQDIL